MADYKLPITDQEDTHSVALRKKNMETEHYFGSEYQVIPDEDLPGSQQGILPASEDNIGSKRGTKK